VAEAADAEHRHRLSGATRATLIALYVVTPPQVSGAASRGEMPSGTGVANAAGSTAYSANVPFTE
jgi:hypothetical protein